MPDTDRIHTKSAGTDASRSGCTFWRSHVLQLLLLPSLHSVSKSKVNAAVKSKHRCGTNSQIAVFSEQLIKQLALCSHLHFSNAVNHSSSKKKVCVCVHRIQKKKSLMCVEDECVACEGEEKEQHVVKVCVTTTTSVLLGALLGALFLALFLGLLLCRFCRLFLLTLLLTLLLLGALLFLRSRGG